MAVASSKYSRGRPRLTTSSPSTTERRRAQVREAQRTYRLKKETASKQIQTRLLLLEQTLSQVQILFHDLSNTAIKSNSPEMISAVSQASACFETCLDSLAGTQLNSSPSLKAQTPVEQDSLVESVGVVSSSLPAVSGTSVTSTPSKFSSNRHESMSEIATPSDSIHYGHDVDYSSGVSNFATPSSFDDPLSSFATHHQLYNYDHNEFTVPELVDNPYSKVTLFSKDENLLNKPKSFNTSNIDAINTNAAVMEKFGSYFANYDFMLDSKIASGHYEVIPIVAGQSSYDFCYPH